jgi:hypothetical protein
VSELPHQEFMFTLAEVAAAFVGFSLIGGILRSADDGATRFLLMRDVAQVSLTAVAGSLLPYVLFQFGLEGESLWRISSVGLALGWVVGGAFAYRRASTAGILWEWAPALLVVGSLGNLGGAGLLLWSAFLGGSLSGSRYILALLILLTLAGLMFIWATFQKVSDPPPAQQSAAADSNQV